MKTLKLLGIIALSALIMIFAASCEGLFGDPIDGPDGPNGPNGPNGPTGPTGPDTDDMPGSVVIKVTSYGEQGSGLTPSISYVEEELTAEFTQGSPYIEENALVYQWYVVTNGNAVETYTGGDPNTGKKKTFKPLTQTGGTYTVRVTSAGFDGFVTPQTQVTVKPRPAHIAFFGPWKSGTFTPTGAGTGNDHYETLVITDGKFRLDSTWDGVANHNVAQSTGAKEYVEWKIDSWSVLTGADLTVSNTTYASGFKLAVSGRQTKGYEAANYQRFNLYLVQSISGGSAIQIRRSGESSGEGAPVMNDRTYTRQ